MKKVILISAILLASVCRFLQAQLPDVLKWHKYELQFSGSTTYENPVQDVKSFEVDFVSPTGIRKTITGFWDGGTSWKARFMPWETGTWTFETKCSDAKNQGLNGQKGSFLCKPNTDQKDIYKHGPIINPAGTFYLTHADGTPFFWLACTAWNGALKSTDTEWDQYLQQRISNNYSAIQLVTTQWRGCDRSSEGLVAFEGSGRTKMWSHLPPRPVINLEPNYEEINFNTSDRDVRNAVYWSLFATPIAGITYGANGIWPWLHKGERILNHGDSPGTSSWDVSINFPGSIQMGYLARFIKKFEWWRFYPSPELLAEQPGENIFNQFVSVVKTPDNKTILAYLPVKQTIKIRKPADKSYSVRWFDPVKNTYSDGIGLDDGNMITITSPNESDMVLILEESIPVNIKIQNKKNVIKNRT